MTRKQIFFIGAVLGAAAMLLLAASVPFQAFNTNQFNTNGSIVSIDIGAQVTNLAVSSLLLVNVSSNSILTIGNNRYVTNMASGVNGQALVADSGSLGGAKWSNFPAGGGSGTVTSVSGPSIITWANSTTTPTGTLNNQTSNTFLAGPINNGAAATPTFRLMAMSDLKAAFPSTNLGTATTFDCLSSFNGYRSVTNSALTISIANAYDGYDGSFDVFMVGATSSTVTFTDAQSRTNIAPGGFASTFPYQPGANVMVSFKIHCVNGCNEISPDDNLK